MVKNLTLGRRSWTASTPSAVISAEERHVMRKFRNLERSP